MLNNHPHPHQYQSNPLNNKPIKVKSSSIITSTSSISSSTTINPRLINQQQQKQQQQPHSNHHQIKIKPNHNINHHHHQSSSTSSLSPVVTTTTTSTSSSTSSIHQYKIIKPKKTNLSTTTTTTTSRNPTHNLNHSHLVAKVSINNNNNNTIKLSNHHLLNNVKALAPNQFYSNNSSSSASSPSPSLSLSLLSASSSSSPSSSPSYLPSHLSSSSPTVAHQHSKLSCQITSSSPSSCHLQSNPSSSSSCSSSSISSASSVSSPLHPILPGHRQSIDLTNNNKAKSNDLHHSPLLLKSVFPPLDHHQPISHQKTLNYHPQKFCSSGPSTSQSTPVAHRSSPSTSLKLPSVLHRDTDEQDTARVNRQILDLEISNASLMAINGALERTKLKQQNEIRELKKKLNVNSPYGINLDAEGIKTPIDLNGTLTPANDPDETGESLEELISQDQQFGDLIKSIESLISSGTRAIQSKLQPPSSPRSSPPSSSLREVSPSSGDRKKPHGLGKTKVLNPVEIEEKMYLSHLHHSTDDLEHDQEHPLKHQSS